MRNLIIPAVLLLIISLTACKKDKNNSDPAVTDYREEFTGNFHFTIIADYSGPMGIGIDTNYCDGFVRKYFPSDTIENFYLDDSSVSSDIKIYIYLNDDQKTFTVLNEDGTFVELSDLDFKQTGYFTKSKDEIHMTRHVYAGATHQTTDFTITGLRY